VEGAAVPRGDRPAEEIERGRGLLRAVAGAAREHAADEVELGAEVGLGGERLDRRVGALPPEPAEQRVGPPFARLRVGE